MGTLELFKSEIEKAFREADHPRGPDGRWIKNDVATIGHVLGVEEALRRDQEDHERGDATLKAKNDKLHAAFKGTGVRVGKLGESSTATEKDIQGWADDVKKAVKKFPELKTGLKTKLPNREKSLPLGKIEFMAMPTTEWGQAIRDDADFAHTVKGETSGGLTAPRDDSTGPIYIMLNDDYNLGDGVHTAATVPPSGWFADGSRDTAGQLMHEIGHALIWAAGFYDSGGYQDTPRMEVLFENYGLKDLSHNISTYANEGEAPEAFGEMFADYMRGNLKGKDKANFENLLSFLLGRKV